MTDDVLGPRGTLQTIWISTPGQEYRSICTLGDGPGLVGDAASQLVLSRTDLSDIDIDAHRSNCLEHVLI